MYKLILVRHGESVWNKENRFTVDGCRSEERGARSTPGRRADQKVCSFFFDVAYSSVLKRAIRTQHILAEVVDRVGA
ncbi:MAG: histidine phosphatase family protein [Butyricimonas faecalis]